MNSHSPEPVSIFSFAPLLIGGVIALVSLFVVLSGPPEHTILFWEEFFNLILHRYFIVALIFFILNSLFLYFQKPKRYPVFRNLFYSAAGLVLSFIIFVFWNSV